MDPFQEFTDVHEAFPGLDEGIEMQEKLFQKFAIQHGLTIPWYDEAGRQNIFPHQENIRGHQQILAKYEHWVRKYGLVSGVRGLTDS